jgi:hypothetical protein
MEKEITMQDIERRLAALETTVASLTAEKKPQAETISFENLGGKKWDIPFPFKQRKKFRLKMWEALHQKGERTPCVQREARIERGW